MAVELLAFPLKYSNVFLLQSSESYRIQREFFQEAYKVARSEQARLDIMFCWQYVKRGLWEIDIDSGKILIKA